MLLTPFTAFLLADGLGVSGVLAVVAAGIYLARRSSSILEPVTRLQAAAIWEIVIFVLNGLLFIILGVQLHGILNDVSVYPLRQLVVDALVICLVVVLLRPLWIVPTELLESWFIRWRGGSDQFSWRTTLVIAWTGMRGSASIAAALAIPFVVKGRAPFPARSLIIYLVFCAIVFTLVVQGLSLPVLVRRLGITGSGERADEERRAREMVAHAAITRIEQLAGEEWVTDAAFSRVLADYTDRLHHAHAECHSGRDESPAQLATSLAVLRREAIDAERRTLIQLRNDGTIDEDVMRCIERDLDLEETRLNG
jgi:CPA1 family monovalent cation:H+ antiporter